MHSHIFIIVTYNTIFLYLMYVTISKGYSIRNETSTSFLIRVNNTINTDRSNFEAFCIPPFIGYILAHIGDHEYNKSIKKIGQCLNVSIEAIDRFVQQLIDNTEKKEFMVDDKHSIVLPKYLLTKTESKCNAAIFEQKKFNKFGYFDIRRPSAPLSVNIMVTTKCNADCIYCYANRNIGPELSTEKILCLIDDLYDQGTINITLTGGDVFTHPDWRKILKRCRLRGYKPFLSTKTPLEFDQIEYLKDLGYTEIQFSLDSANSEILKQLINANSRYIDKVILFFKCCSEMGVDVSVRSVLTKFNASKIDITNLYNFLSTFNCIKEWTLTPAFFSPYKKNKYKDIEVNNNDLVDIYKFTHKECLSFPILLNKISERGYTLKKYKDVEAYVGFNQICMANTTSISILANGDCSICEMLYDNPEYLLGNINKYSISEIWNSEKALNLYHLRQDDIPQESPCSICNVFDRCRKRFGKKVCYLDISKSGQSKFFPDPRCPHAKAINFIL